MAGAEPLLKERAATPLVFNSREGEGAFVREASGGMELLEAVDGGERDFNLRIDVSNLKRRGSELSLREGEGWGIVLKGGAAEYRILLSRSETEDGDISSSGAARLRLSSRKGEDADFRNLFDERRRCAFCSPLGLEGIEISRRGGEWKAAVAVGQRAEFSTLPIPADFALDSIGVFTEPKGGVKVRSAIYIPAPAASDLELKNYDEKGLENRFSQTLDTLEGIWEWYDSAIDETRIESGGNYRIAIVGEDAEHEGEKRKRYMLVYQSGARVNKRGWHSGMVKGEMYATSAPGVYDVVWVDSNYGLVDNELKGVVGENGIIMIYLPHANSEFRLRKRR